VTDRRLTVAVLGAGVVGRTLARGWVRAGHAVLLGTRDPDSDRIRAALDELGEGAVAALHRDAARRADVVVITVPGDQVPDLLDGLGDALAHRPVIDASNRIGAAEPGAVRALRAAGATPYRAYNSVGWEQMAEPAFGGVPSDLLYAGPSSFRDVVEGLIRDTGFRPVHAGEDDGAYAAVDALGRVWIQLVFRAGYGRRLGFRILTADDD
jgi:predicted dinucleotide-binding enzyme